MQHDAMQSPLSHTPLARILLPLIAGIIASSVSGNITMPIALLAVGIFIWVALIFTPRTPSWSLKLRPWWILPVALISIAIGWGNAILCTPPELDLNKVNSHIAMARINDLSYSENLTNIDATLTTVLGNDNSQLLTHQHNISITTRGCNYTWQPGDVLAFKLQLDTIRNTGNPDSFDYQQHMLDRGIRYNTHIPARELTRLYHNPTLLTRCAQYRHRLQRAIFESSLSEPAQNFVIATLLGNSKLISPETRSQFAAAGISHVLALSGLHVGIIMAIVWFFLFPLDYMHLRRLRLIITILVMALYATFTGLSPSVVRATIMMTIVIIGLIFYRKSVSLNSLCAAAIIILILSPSALRSVGFQLSFITVAAFMLTFRNNTTPGRLKQSKLWKYIKSTIAASFIAMLSTIMLTAWYFNSMSFISVIANLFILPLFPVVMIFSALMILMCAMHLYIEPLNRLVDMLYSIIDWFTRTITDYIPGYFDNIYITGYDVLIYYVALIMILLWYRSRRFKWINWAVACIAIIVLHSAYIKTNTPTHGYFIFSNHSQTPIVSISKGKSRLWVPDALPDVEYFKQYNSQFLAHYGINEIDTIGSSLEFDEIQGTKIVCIADGKWKYKKKLETKIETDLLVITKRYHGTLETLLGVFTPKTIVLSGDLYIDDYVLMVEQCQKSGIPYYDISRSGAWVKIKD